MQNSTFQSFARIVDAKFGIQLPPAKKALLESRLYKLLQSHDFTGQYKSAESFLAYVEGDRTGQAIRELSEAITTHHTFFMRESDHFIYFRDHVLPWIEDEAAYDHDIRVWCAASSTGEEAYALAFMLADYFALKTPSWERSLLATDLSREVIDTAARGRYPRDAVKTLPASWQQLYFRYDGNVAQVADEIRNAVTFRPFNLMTPVFPFRRKFHAIFCRNVMIYFDLPTRQELLRKFYGGLLPGGYLFVGHAEAIPPGMASFAYVEPSIYRKPLKNAAEQSAISTHRGGLSERIHAIMHTHQRESGVRAKTDIVTATQSNARTADNASMNYTAQRSGAMVPSPMKSDAKKTTLDVTPSSAASIVDSMREMIAPQNDSDKAATNAMKQPFSGIKLIAIGASTGGTEALAKVLKMLVPPLPPIVVVQHIPPVFSAMFADRLNAECKLSAKEAADGERLLQNHIYIAAGDKHLKVKKLGPELFAIAKPGPLVNGHCPSVDVLFDSCAELKDRAIGIILTGMGDDGARGLLKMRRAGAQTFGQDEKTCVVYGMPKAAKLMDAVGREAPLDAMAGIIKAVCG